MIGPGGWLRYSIWDHSETVRDLYARRCRLEAEEMTAHAQAAELLAQHVRPGDMLLDVGCGSGYFFHSLRKRGIPVEYYGIDASPGLIALGQRLMPEHGLARDRLIELRIEDLCGEVDHVVCINVVSNIDNFHRPFERILKVARKTAVFRESFAEKTEYLYVRDEFLDSEVDLKVHVNTYAVDEVAGFVGSYGFKTTWHEDRYSGGKPQRVIGYPHHWKFLVAERAGKGA